MRLRRLHLARFGHFTGEAIDFGPKPGPGEPDFHVIYGLNEAGKTTFLNAVLRLLFGFRRANAEPYDFLHGGDLEVGAEIEGLAGRSDMTVRRIKTGNALLDAAGERLPDDLFAGALGGLGEEEYRLVFSLDRGSVVAGAEDIRKGGGEAGRLLFAAHAGLSTLTASLDAIEREAQEIWRLGGHKQRVPLIKKEIDRLGRRIREIDVTAPKFERLRTEARRARARRDARRVEAETVKTELRRIDGRLALRDLGARLLALREQLDADFDGLPDWTEDPHERPLSRLGGDLRSAVDRLADIDRTVARLEAEREGSASDEAALAQSERLDAMEPLRAAALGAQRDYARRRARAAEIWEEMERRLAPYAPLRETLALAPEAVEALQSAERALEKAEGAAETARREREGAEAKLARRRDQLADDLRDPPLAEPVAARLALLGLDAAAETAATARDAISRQSRRADDALASLSLAGRDFTAAPDTDLTGKVVADRAAAHAGLSKSRAAAEARVAEEVAALAQAEADLARMEAGFGADAIDIAESRDRRDRAWTRHRGALDAGTAEGFEREMRRHDEAEAVRFARARDVAEVAALRRRRDETRARLEAATDAAAKAAEAVSASETAHRDALGALGLPEALGRDEFSDWLARAAIARHEALTLAQERAAQAEPLAREAAAAAEARALSTDLAGLDDARVLAVAAERLAAHVEAATARTRALKTIDEEKREAERRREAESRAETALSHAQAAWAEAIARRLPEGHAIADPRAALPALAEVCRNGREWRDLTERARKLRDDAAAFVGEVARVSMALGERNELSDGERGEEDPTLLARLDRALAAEKTLQMRLDAARQVERRRAALDHDLEEARKTRAALEAERDAAERAIGLYRARFGDASALDGVAALEQAVGRAREATRLRADARALERRLREAAPAAENPLAEAQALAESDLEGERERTQETLDAFSAALSEADMAFGAAQAALDSVTGADDVARLEADRAALEEELQALVLEHARKRMGLELARRAIDAYRRDNRSEMMRAAGEAFERLTQGRYSGLTSRAEGGRDVLVAIRREDGATRRAEDMSEGARMQLYFALRVAAYENRVRSLPACPFVADDVFESFDDYRTEAACAQMSALGLLGQSIYLTHHSEVGVRALKACAGRDLVRFLPGVPEDDRARLAPAAWTKGSATA